MNIKHGKIASRNYPIKMLVNIPYEDMIDNPDVLEDLKDLGNLTQNMVF